MLSFNNPGLPWILDVNPYTHPIPTEKPAGIPQRISILTEPKNSVSFFLMGIFLFFVVYHPFVLYSTA